MHYRSRSLFLAAALVLFAATVLAQEYPTKAVRMIGPSSPGGGIDTNGRILAAYFTQSMGQQFILENRPGAGGRIGTELASKAPPDGYTLLLSAAAAMTIHPNTYKSIPYDPVRDFAPISLVALSEYILAVHPSLPVKSVKDLVALARRKPGMLNYGSAGTGSFTHLAMALLTSMTGVEMAHVPYKGSTQASMGVMTGEAQLLFSSPAAVLGQVKEGRLRAIGVSGTTRTAILPEVPTIAEAGVAGYDATSWYGMLAPAGMPRAALSKLSEESARALGTADLKERLLFQGIDPAKGGAEEFAAVLKTEIPKWEKVIKAAKIPPQ